MFAPGQIKHCVRCGNAVRYLVPPGDNRERATCPHCGHIEYENPRNVVGTIPVWNDQVLLCKRAIEPRYGLWTLPAGFMELGETTEQGALRETLEEAGAQVQLQGLFAVMSVVRVGQVHMFYRAHLLGDSFRPGEETLEARLFAEEDIPWEQLAFRTVREALRCFFSDRQAGVYGVHTQDIA